MDKTNTREKRIGRHEKGSHPEVRRRINAGYYISTSGGDRLTRYYLSREEAEEELRKMIKEDRTDKDKTDIDKMIWKGIKG